MQQPLHAQEWNVPDVLPAIPSGYNLGYSHVIVDGVAPQTLANLIVNGLAKHSIAAVPHEENENSLLAEATCGLKFAINLFEIGNGNRKVVVEVQRFSGCSYGFHVAASVILKSVRGIPLSRTPSLELPKSIPQDAQEERRKCIEFDTYQALDLVRSHRKDAQLLGLQSLERLSTDEHAAGLLQNNESIASLQSFLQSESPTCVMKRRALGILANIMKTCPKPEDRCDKLQCRVFLETLFGILEKHASSPHEACAATRCLQSSLEALSKDKHDDLAALLVNFQANHHSQLRRESKLLHDRLLQHRF